MAATEVRAHQVNFTVLADSDRAELLPVQIGDRNVVFHPTASCGDVVRLLRAKVYESAPLTEIRFPTWSGATEEELEKFALDVSQFCGFVAQQQTNSCHILFYGDDGQPTKVRFVNPMRSGFRDRYLLPGLHFENSGLSQFFAECFDNFVLLSRDSAWRRLFNYAWTFNDGVYLDSRLGTLLAGVELLIRNSLIESKLKTSAECEELSLPELIGAAKRLLGWDIPKHYTQLERYRHVRNASAHAGDLPCTPREALDLQQKWGSFLYRRLFLQLGYTGQVWSASRGWSTVSEVSDFSEGANSFAHQE